jgi:prevent-host-death family protein
VRWRAVVPSRRSIVQLHFYGYDQSPKSTGAFQKDLDKTTRPDQVDFMKVINVQEAKTHLSRLLDQVAAGEAVLLGKHGKPLAKLTAYAPQSEIRPLGGYEGQIRIAPDFDAEDERVNLLFTGE